MIHDAVQTISKGKSLPAPRSGSQVRLNQAMDSLSGICDSMSPGDRLPTHTELVRQLQMPERVVLAALKELHRTGRVERVHGSGTYITDKRSKDLGKGSGLTPEPTLHRTIVALALPDNSFYDRSIEHLSSHVTIASHDLLVRPVPVGSDLQKLANELSPAAGFIIFSHVLSELAAKLLDRGERVVNVGTPLADTYINVPTVYCDQEAGGYAVASRMIALGHRNIAFAHQQSDYLRQTIRWSGHMRALVEAQRAGLRIKSTVIDAAEFAAIDSTPGGAKAYFSQPDAPTAIVAWNDMEAMRVLSMLTRHGVSVPGQVSVAGYDATVHGAVMHPPLTTVDNALDQQLRAAVDLLTRSTPPPATYTMVMQPILIERESTGQLRSGWDKA